MEGSYTFIKITESIDKLSGLRFIKISILLLYLKRKKEHVFIIKKAEVYYWRWKLFIMLKKEKPHNIENKYILKHSETKIKLAKIWSDIVVHALE